MNSKSLFRFVLLLSGILLFSLSSFAQPSFTLSDKKDACGGSSNGQITVNVTSGVGDIIGFIFSTGAPIQFSPTVGVPFIVTDLTGTLAGRTYTVIMSDDVDTAPTQFFTIFAIAPDLAVTNQNGFPFPLNNNSCVNPTGQIRITASGGTGNYSYSWTGPNGYTSTNDDIMGLAGGSYTVRVFDTGTICYVDLGPVLVTDPMPNDRPITNDGNQTVCFGSSFDVLIGNSENNVVYEVFRCVAGDCNNLQTTGASATSGSNGSIVTITVPNAGTTFVSGDILKVQASLQNCSPILLSDQINITVTPTPQITNAPLTQNICSNGAATLTITSDQPGTTFAWTAVASAGTITGFDAVGVGNINDLNIQNSGVTAGTVTYTITPTLNGCPGTPVNFVVTVQPNATITNVTLTDDVCSNETISFTPTSNVVGATFSWTASASNGNITGFDLSGTGPINDANVVNAGIVAGTVTYVITPIATGCNGTPANFVVTVQPNVTVTNATLTDDICSNETITFTPTSNIAGATFSWTASASNGNISGFDLSGNGNINDANVVNTGTIVGTVTYVITPTANGCAGTPVNFVVTVNPNVTVTNAPLTQNICSNGTASLIITSNVTGATFSWTAVASNGNITGFFANGTGNINDANILNSGIVSGTVTYTITPTANGCPGVPSNYVVTVQPNATITNVTLTDDICSNETVTFTPTSNIAGATFTWTASASNGNISGFDLSGSGNINDANVINTGTTAGTVTYVVTPVANGCNGTPANFVVTVQPNVAVTNAPLTQNICNNGTASLIITSNIAGATFSWTAVASNGNITGFDANGTGNINDANILNSGIVAGTVTYTITPTANGCPGVTSNYVVTVQPNAIITNGTLTDDICSNETVAFTPTSNIAGATFSWTASASNGNISGFDLSGTGNINDANVINTGATAGTVTYVITPIANGCNGTPSNFVVTVQPNVTITNSPLTQNICSNGTASLTITSNVAGATFSWTAVASNGNISGFDANGTGNINDAGILNSGIVAGTVTYTITATANGCPSATANYVVTVQPNATITNATLTDDICSNETVTFTPTSNIAGATFSWTASASNGNISGFDLSGTGPINDANVINTGVVAGTVTYVITPIANGCNGTPANLVVTVQPNVTVTNAPLTDDICSNETITFTPTSNIAGATFSWTASASNGNISGFDANGTGNINDTNVINTGATAGTVTYVITPTANGCAGTPVNFVVTVSPNVAVTNAPLTQNICSNGTASLIITSNIAGATFSWTAVASNGNITGFDANGTGNINDANILNSGIVAGTVTYTITPTANGCPGVTSDFVVTVQPNATITNVTLTDDICSNETVAFTPTSNVAGATFTWTASASNGNISGFDLSGAGDINDANVINTGTTAGTITYVITPVANGCNGTPANFVVTVQPNVTVTNSPLTQNICNNGTASLTITSNIAGATFSWTAVASNGNISGFDANGVGNINDANILNSGIVAGTVTYTITPTANGCAGTAVDFVVTVQPDAVITNVPLTDDICSNETVSFTPTSNITGATFSWTASASNGNISGFDLSGTGPINDANVINTGLVAGTVTYVITPIANGCNGTPSNFVVTVQPGVNVTNVTLTDDICSNETITFTPTSNIAGATFSWTASASNGNITGFDANGTGNINDANVLNTGLVAGTVTYVITATANGCSSTPVNFVVTVNPVPDAGFTGLVTPICITNSAITLTPNTAGGTFSGNGISGSTFNPALAGLGTHTITYQLTVSGCVNSSTQDVTVNPSPDATITPAGPFCANDAAVNLTAATAGGTWSGVGITDPVLGTFDPATAGAGTKTISYSVTVGGCTSNATTNIAVFAAPDATITPVGPFCSIDPAINLTAATAGGVWSGPGITDGVLGTFDPGAANIGNNLITYSITIGTCVDSKTTTISVGTQPDATITAVGPLCTADAGITLAAVTPGGTWTGTGITDPNTGAFDPAVAGAGTHNIIYTIAIGGCNDSDNIDIVVNQSPDATITAAGPFCTTDPAVNLTAATAGGVWSGPGITDVVLGTFTPASANIGANLISYTVTVGSCSDTKTISITVGNQPDATITAVGPVCTGDTPLTLTAVTAGGVWSGTGITDVNAGTFDPLTAGIGTHTITYTIAIGGCNDTDDIDIVVNQSPDATITAAGPFCVTDPAVNLVAVTPGGTWSGTGITNAANGTFDPATATAGTYTITYSVTSGSCTSNDDVSITVGNQPDATITAVGPFCTADAGITLTAVTAGGTWAGAGITDPNTGAFDPAIAGAGTHNITYTIAIGGCNDSDNIDIVVNQSPDATITGQGPFCISDAAVNLVAATAGGTWTGTGITDTTLGTFDPSIAGAGSFPISYSITSGLCSDNDQVTITVSNPPDATITSTGPFCSTGSPVNLTAVTPGGTWSGTGITDASTGAFSPSVAGVGTHTISYTIAIGSCNDNKTADIQVDLAPDATINPAGPYCPSDPAVTLTAGEPGGTWSGIGITDPSGEFDPAVAGTGTHAISYTITSNGCTSTDSFDMVVRSAVDPACGSGGTDCFAFTIVPDLTISKRPSCSGQDDGVYSVDIMGNPGYLGKLDVSLWVGPTRIDGYVDFARNFTFSALSPGSYELRLADEDGNICVKPFELKVETTVSATATTVSNSLCFDQPNGVASLVVTGGNSPYEYSIDGGLSYTDNYVSGNEISNLPVGSYNILVRDDNVDACPAEVAVTIGNDNGEIEYFVAVANETECSAGDGELRVTGINGGSGNKQIRLYRIENAGPVLQVDYTDVVSTDYAFTNLLSGTYFVELKDGIGCEVDNEASAGTITSPGGIDFTVRLVANAECGERAGKNGVIGISLDPLTSSGSYKIGVSTSSLIEPANYGDYFYTQGQVDEILIDTLSRGNFFVFIKPSGNTVCPSFQPTGFLDGPYIVDFDVQRVCGLNDGSTAVNLVNVTGDPLVTGYNIEVYKMSDLAVKVDDFILDKVNDILTITYVPTGTGEHVWLNTPDDYLIRVYQANQLYCLGERPFRTPSHEEVYAVRETIAVTIGKIKPSLPEPRQTGSFVLSTITGGVPFPDEEGPYYNVSVYDPTNDVELFGPLEVRRNSQGRYEYEFRNIPTANYRVEVTDSFGCTISTIVIVPADTRLLIPNIFTPNGDAFNDEFEVLNLPTGAHKLVVTNRWGKEIFVSNDYKEGYFWSGDEAPEGIYYYRLDVEADQTYSGWVELRRGAKP